MERGLRRKASIVEWDTLILPDKEKVIKGLEYCTAPGRNCDMRCPYVDENDCEVCLERDALALLKEQKRGHWVLDPDGMDWNIPAWCCSVCGCRNDNIPPNVEKENPRRWSGSKYCPNCGAKMDEEVSQDE